MFYVLYRQYMNEYDYPGPPEVVGVTENEAEALGWRERSDIDYVFWYSTHSEYFR